MNLQFPDAFDFVDLLCRGPIVGPVAGGFVAEQIGFKYIFVIIACLAAVASAVGEHYS